MEKLMYMYWRGNDEPAQLRARFATEVAPRLRALGVERLQLNVADLGDLSDCIDHLRLTNLAPKPDGFVSFWLTSAWRRAPAEKLLAAQFARIAGYVVLESTILPNVEHPPGRNERTHGFSQVSLLQVPRRMSFEEWRGIWLNRHTPVGVDTQSNFRYVQNVVVLALTPGAPPWRGIVEECFPSEALRDLRTFYDASGDEDKFQRNLQLMIESCAAFIDADKIDVIATSEYMLHAEPEPTL